MDTANRRHPGPVTAPAGDDELFARPYAFDFFALLRELARRYPERAPVGGDGPPRDELVRFRSDPRLAFPASEVAALAPPRDGRPAELTVSLVGMLGNTGVLPWYLTEWVRDAGPDGEPLREFLDLFLHRPLSLLHAIGEALRPGGAYERRRGGAGWWVDDPYVSTALRASGAAALPGDLAGRFAGTLIPLGRYVGSVTAYEDAAAAHLGVPVAVAPLCGRWRDAPPPREGDVRDVRAALTVRVGPMGWDDYRDFLPPDGPALRDLLQLTRLFAGVRDFDVELFLRPDERPACVPGRGPRLGLTAWPVPPAGAEHAPLRGHIPAAVCRQLAEGDAN